MSKYVRLNLEKSRNSRPIPNVEKLISEIKHLNDRPKKRVALKSSTSISRRLLPGQNQPSKTRGCSYLQNKPPPKPKTKQKSDVWDEIEKEQEQLNNLLHPPEYIPETHKTRVQPFSLQTSHFDKHPFHQFMGNEESKDLLYDVDSNLQVQNKKILPRSNFGRRLNDNNRSLVQKTEAPDKIYGDMNNNWKKVHKSSGTGPLFDNSPPQKLLMTICQCQKESHINI